ncbi:hypothetical protein Val02_74410 [Virgisporangium aliadipatigenens]|uniref:Uncharacterized protein n=1 Tax=Virgisporangium aliadipatigenens TaxID=741659 RepID=A0A8J3YVG8_9ACTN|nr:hypothetical protein Val02_74410 [Virgisporangium aliadipatigenens]
MPEGRFRPVHDWLFADQDRLNPVTLTAALTNFLNGVQSDFVSSIRSGVNGHVEDCASAGAVTRVRPSSALSARAGPKCRSAGRDGVR